LLQISFLIHVFKFGQISIYFKAEDDERESSFLF